MVFIGAVVNTVREIGEQKESQVHLLRKNKALKYWVPDICFTG